MREIKGKIKYIIIGYAMIASLFHIYTGIFGTIHSMLHVSNFGLATWLVYGS